MDTPILIPTDMNRIPFFYLLQISDPLFPIGGFTQSYGLETYVQKGLSMMLKLRKNTLKLSFKQLFVQ